MKKENNTLTSNDKEFYARPDDDLFYVYCIICKTTNRKYIGARATRNINAWELLLDPLKDHYLGSSDDLKKDIDKGIDEGLLVNQIVEKFILCTAKSIDELKQMEKDKIKYYKAVEDPTFYNKHQGGNGWRSYTTATTKKKKRNLR